MLSIGLMSGTSMDGIDAALLETDGSPSMLNAQGHIALAYAPECKWLLKAAEFSIKKCFGDAASARAYFPQGVRDYLQQELHLSESACNKELTHLACYLFGKQHATDQPLTLDAVIQHSTHLHAQAVNLLLHETGFSHHRIGVIGYHGQTMFHCPANRLSVIVGKGNYLADHLGIPVVTDFRSHDISLGGQGAPFAPLYHQALAIQSNCIPIAVVNCGGIANVTLIESDNPWEMIAFDTGPGNGLIDKLVRQRTGGRESMDTNGYYGKKGVVHEEVLNCLYQKSILHEGSNYFTRLPPKALDVGDMVLIPEIFALSLEDACATLEAFTADSIVTSLQLTQRPYPRRWVLAGGGWNNPVIRDALTARLQHTVGAEVDIKTADDMGWNSQAMEAQLFAYLAVRSLDNKPLSYPGTTGVPWPATGGTLYTPSANRG